MIKSDSLTENYIIKKLDGREKLPPINPYPDALLRGESKSAAVLMPMFCHQEEWHLLYIRRTISINDRHSGQVAFPGGRCDPDDQNPVSSALREAYEEVGIESKDVKILGHMEKFKTITNYAITPIVGVFPWPYPLKPSPTEVKRVFSIPIKWLTDPSNHTYKKRRLDAVQSPLLVIFFKPYDNEVLWGASARITLQFLSILELLP
jgi:8-oxo-dGTP pyrophosphatase MutT (NUDIX family)